MILWDRKERKILKGLKKKRKRKLRDKNDGTFIISVSLQYTGKNDGRIE